MNVFFFFFFLSIYPATPSKVALCTQPHDDQNDWVVEMKKESKKERNAVAGILYRNDSEDYLPCWS